MVEVFWPQVRSATQGCSKLRHKLAALLHQIKLETGCDVQIMKRYLAGVLAICTDHGVESSLSETPGLDLQAFLQQEAQALGMDPALPSATPAPAALLNDDDGAFGFAHSQTVDLTLETDQPLEIKPHHQAAEHIAGPGKLLPNSIYIPGIKHAMDNAANDLWSAMSHQSDFMTELRAVESLVRPRRMREKLVHVFFNSNDDHGADEAMAQDARENLRSWTSSLKSLRWHEVVNFLRELATVRVALTRKWNLLRFTQALPKEREGDRGSWLPRAENDSIGFCSDSVELFLELLRLGVGSCWDDGFLITVERRLLSPRRQV